MNYIVFDLEWNQSPGGKKWSNSRLPFEIIEIGAVKLNEKKEIVDLDGLTIQYQAVAYMKRMIQKLLKDVWNGDELDGRCNCCNGGWCTDRSLWRDRLVFA